MQIKEWEGKMANFLNKSIFIQNAVGGSGKDTFANLLNKYIPTYKYSIIELPKFAAKTLGWDGISKTEKDRKFLSDIMDLATEYNDSPFSDVISIVSDFKNNLIKENVLLIDMREGKDINRAVNLFGAKTILIRNPKIKPIYSNRADANVEKYKYDFIIENNGTLKQLDAAASFFADNIKNGYSCSKYRIKPYIINCNKIEV